LSYVHALLSAGKEWIAERVNLEDSDFRNIVGSGMVILDTMEELGMEKHYRSVEKLERDSTGLVVPKIVPAIAEDQEIARVTNLTLLKTAGKYRGIGTGEVLQLLKGIPQLVEQSQSGMPFTLTNAIPSMDSKEEHFENIRKSKLFDYPALIL
jgi:hypothetical protein